MALTAPSPTGPAVHLTWRMTVQDRRAAQGPPRGVPALAALVVPLGLVLAPTALLEPVTVFGMGLLLLWPTAVALWWQAHDQRRHVGLVGGVNAVWHLQATASGLAWTFEGEAGASEWHEWHEVRRIRVLRHHVLLQLQAGPMVAVPRRAFGSEAAEREALSLLRSWRRRAPLTPPREPGLAGFDLRYALTTADLLGLAGSGGGRVLWRLVAGQISGGAPVRGGLRLKLGPAGGWIGARGGVHRFSWRDVGEVVVVGGLVALMSRGGPVLVPLQALDDPSAFVKRCRAWVVAARQQARPRPPASTPPDPFAPPE